MADRFDFRTANKLVELVEKTASALDVQNGQMETRFGRLHDFFRDEGYDEFTADMSAANRSVAEVIKQMHAVSRALANYADILKQNS